MKRKFLIICCLVGCFGLTGMAQDDPQLTHFFANKLYYNPAATGNDNLLNANLTDREQWFGIKGRPRYSLLNASQFFGEKSMGAGLSLIHYTAGAEQNLNIKGSYAYHIQMGDEMFISLGIGAGMFSKSLSEEGRTASGRTDLVEKKVISDLNFGVEFYTRELTIGLSATHVPVVFGSKDYRVSAHYYYYMAYLFEINREWGIQPSIVLRNASFISNIDIGVRALYNDLLFFGASYRLDAITILAGVHINEFFSVSYSYDVGLSTPTYTKPGSHELTLSTRLNVFNLSSSSRGSSLFQF